MCTGSKHLISEDGTDATVYFSLLVSNGILILLASICNRYSKPLQLVASVSDNGIRNLCNGFRSQQTFL